MQTWVTLCLVVLAYSFHSIKTLLSRLNEQPGVPATSFVVMHNAHIQQQQPRFPSEEPWRAFYCLHGLHCLCIAPSCLAKLGSTFTPCYSHEVKGGVPSLQPGWDCMGEERERFGAFCTAAVHWNGHGWWGDLKQREPPVTTSSSPVSLRGTIEYGNF